MALDFIVAGARSVRTVHLPGEGQRRGKGTVAMLV